MYHAVDRVLAKAFQRVGENITKAHAMSGTTTAAQQARVYSHQLLYVDINNRNSVHKQDLLRIEFLRKNNRNARGHALMIQHSHHAPPKSFRKRMVGHVASHIENKIRNFSKNRRDGRVIW